MVKKIYFLKDNAIVINGTSHPVDLIDASPNSVKEFVEPDFTLESLVTIGGEFKDVTVEKNGVKLAKREFIIDKESFLGNLEKIYDYLVKEGLDGKSVYIMVSLPVLLNFDYQWLNELNKDSQSHINIVGVVMATDRSLMKKIACAKYFSIQEYLEKPEKEEKNVCKC